MVTVLVFLKHSDDVQPVLVTVVNEIFMKEIVADVLVGGGGGEEEVVVFSEILFHWNNGVFKKKNLLQPP